MFSRLVVLLLLWIVPSYSAPLPVQVNAEAALLMNADTGAILYEKNARRLMYPASTTKIATALYALKVKGNKLHETVVVKQDCVAWTQEEAKKRANYKLPAYWLTPDGSHMGLKTGEEMSLRDLLYGMMLISANDASNAIAHHVGGSVPHFMDGMNAYLKEIGCQNTVFHNPHGLFHPEHQTTAYDMAIMIREGIKNHLFSKIVSTVRYDRPKTNMQESIPLVQTNRLLRHGKYYYSKAIGGKTGYLSKAGHNFVVAARHEDRTLIAVLLKEKERSEMFTDAIKLFETAFNQSKVQRTLIKAGPQSFALSVAGAAKPVKSYLKADAVLAYYPAEEPKVKCLLYWDDITPPIAQNQRVGELRFQSPDGKLWLTAPLLAQEDVNTTWFYALKHWITHLWSSYPILIILAFCLVVIIVFLFLFK